MSARLIILLFVSLCVVSQVGARDRGQVPEAYGRTFIRADAVQTRQIPPLQSAPEGAGYLQRVQQQEWLGGPYGAGLSQSLLDAANYFQSRKGDIISRPQSLVEHLGKTLAGCGVCYEDDGASSSHRISHTATRCNGAARHK